MTLMVATVLTECKLQTDTVLWRHISNIIAKNFLTQEHTDKLQKRSMYNTNKYSTQNHMYTLFFFCSVGFQLEHFGERCFGTGVDQIWFSFSTEKLPVTAPNRWKPVNRNKAFISLPPKNKQRGGIKSKVYLHLLNKGSRPKISQQPVPVTQWILTCQKCR